MCDETLSLRFPKVHRPYWGPATRWGAKKNDPSSKFAFVGGMAITMSRDLAEWIATSDRGAVNMSSPARMRSAPVFQIITVHC
jgi:hypothetical protein